MYLHISHSKDKTHIYHSFNVVYIENGPYQISYFPYHISTTTFFFIHGFHFLIYLTYISKSYIFFPCCMHDIMHRNFSVYRTLKEETFDITIVFFLLLYPQSYALKFCKFLLFIATQYHYTNKQTKRDIVLSSLK